MTDGEFDAYLYDNFLCGCGSPSVAMTALRDLLQSYGSQVDGFRYLGNDVDPQEYLLVNILDDRGLLDHGSSIYGAWITEKGRGVLEYITRELEEGKF